MPGRGVEGGRDGDSGAPTESTDPGEGRQTHESPARLGTGWAPSRSPRVLRISAFVAAFVMVALVFHSPQVAASTPTLSGNNAALARMGGAGAATSSVAGFEPAKAIDGSTSTFWASSAGTANLTVTLFALYSLGEVHVHMAGIAQPDIDLKVDPDGTGTSWSLLKSVRANAALDVILTFSNVAAKQIRVDFLTTVTHTHTTTTQVWVCDLWDYDEFARKRYCAAGHYETRTTTYTENHPPQVAEFEAWGNPNKDTDGDGLADSFEESTWYRQDAMVDGLPKAIPNNGTDVMVLSLDRPLWTGIATRAFLDLEVDHASPGDLAVAVGSWNGTAWRDKTAWAPGGYANASIWDTVVIHHTHTTTTQVKVCDLWDIDPDSGRRVCVQWHYESRATTYTEDHLYPTRSAPADTGRRTALAALVPPTASTSTASGTVWHVTIDLTKAALETWETSAGFRAPAMPAAELHGRPYWRILVRDWNPFAGAGSLRAAMLRTEERSDPTNADTDGDTLRDGVEVGTHGTFPISVDTDRDGARDDFEAVAHTITYFVDGVPITRTVKTDPTAWDTDGDGLSDGEEYNLGVDRVLTNPVLADTDGDSLTDGAELLTYHSNATLTDTDKDTIPDNVEVTPRTLTLIVNGIFQTRSVTTLPNREDTDGDGLRDDKEFDGTSVYGVRTDPSDPDTDRDGLLDGQEKYSREFSLSTRKTVGTAISVSLTATTSGPIERVDVRYGLSTIAISNFYVQITKGSTTVVLRNHVGTGFYNYSSVDITNSFSSHGGLYTLYVSSWSGGGVLEEFALSFTLRTSPVMADSDGDGLNDSEETTYGADGWITDPNRADTDGDGWSDGYEIKTRGTNPLSMDTDQDGVRDDMDIDPLRNLLVAVQVKQVHHGDAWWNPELAAVVRVNEGNAWVYTWVTAHRLGTDDGIDDHTSSFWMTYYADVPDDISGVSIRTTGWSINCCRGDDIIVDYGTTYWLNSGALSYTGYSGNSWITFDVWTYALPKAKAFLITDGNATVSASNGQQRLTGQDRYLVLAFDVTSSSGPFMYGINTIVVPRSIFLQSKLKADFDANSNWPLADATMYGEDFGGTKDPSEGVAGIIAKTLSGSDAYNVLDRLLRNKTNVKVYAYIDITSYASITNLPADVLRILPWAGVTNGPTGEMPKGFWDKISGAANAVINSLVRAGQLIYDGLIAIGTFLMNLGEAIWNFGMKVLGQVWNNAVAVAQRVGELLGRVVDCFVQTAISVITNAISALINGMKALYDATLGRFIRELGEALSTVDPEELARKITGLVELVTAIAVVIALIPVAIRVASIALKAMSLGISWLAEAAISEGVTEFIVRILMGIAFSLALSALFTAVLDAMGWVEDTTNGFFAGLGIASALIAAAAKVVFQVYRSVFRMTANEIPIWQRYKGFAFAVIGLGIVLVGSATYAQRGLLHLAADLAGLAFQVFGIWLYYHNHKDLMVQIGDFAAPVGAKIEYGVVMLSPPVSTAKILVTFQKGGYTP